jgi:membrane associated rhomboid family serine protease
MKITFNAPVVLGFTLLAVAVRGLDDLVFHNWSHQYFSTLGYFHLDTVRGWFQLFSHILGHANWEHLFGNFSFILLIGPILEEKYGSRNLIFMILVTALATAGVNNLFWHEGLLGASGIVFMMILLGSMVNFKAGTIPITFILIVALYLGREIYTGIMEHDQIAQSAHIIGGICGTIFGFLMQRGSGKSA